MKSPLFARPNLKGFLIGALLVAAVHQLTTTVRSEAPKLAAPIPLEDYRASDDEIQQLLAYAVNNPSPEMFRRVSKCYENRGEVRRALLYLRQADKVEPND
jgi:hypothetical protein